MNKINTLLNLLTIALVLGCAIYFTKSINQIALENRKQEETISSIADVLRDVEIELTRTKKLVNEAEVELNDLEKTMANTHSQINNITNRFQTVADRVSSLNRFKADSIKTKRFALLSEDNTERIIMKSYPNRTFMMLKGERNLNRIYFNVLDDGMQSISFSGTDGKAQIGIKTNEKEIPEITVWKGGSFTLRSKKGHHEVIKITESGNSPEVAFYEAICNGAKVWSTNDWWLDKPEPAKKEAEPNASGQPR